jgi:hypothetical protein
MRLTRLSPDGAPPASPSTARSTRPAAAASVREPPRRSCSTASSCGAETRACFLPAPPTTTAIPNARPLSQHPSVQVGARFSERSYRAVSAKRRVSTLEIHAARGGRTTHLARSHGSPAHRHRWRSTASRPFHHLRPLACACSQQGSCAGSKRRWRRRRRGRHVVGEGSGGGITHLLQIGGAFLQQLHDAIAGEVIGRLEDVCQFEQHGVQ